MVKKANKKVIVSNKNLDDKGGVVFRIVVIETFKKAIDVVKKEPNMITDWGDQIKIGVKIFHPTKITSSNLKEVITIVVTSNSIGIENKPVEA